MTLFDLVSLDDVLAKVLEKLFEGCRYRMTILSGHPQKESEEFGKFRLSLRWIVQRKRIF